MTNPGYAIVNARREIVSLHKECVPESAGWGVDRELVELTRAHRVGDRIDYDQHGREIAPDASDLVLCTSADGWSLHAPGSTDEEIASGDAPYLVCGEGEPTEADYTQAIAILMERASR